MVRIKVVPEKFEYSTGEHVKGIVDIQSTENFDFTEMYVELVCAEKTVVEVGSGDDEETYYETFYHHVERIQILEPGEYDRGNMRVAFDFLIPKMLPSSYDGHAGHVEYTLEAKIGRKWALDPRNKVMLMVEGPRKPPLPEQVQRSLLDGETSLMDIEIEKDEIFLGEEIEVNFRVDEKVKMNGVRFDLISRELVVAKGYNDTSRTKLSSVFVDEERIPRGSWNSLSIPTSQFMPATYRGPLITLSIILEIVIDIPWRLDKDLKIEIFTTRAKKGIVS